MILEPGKTYADVSPSGRVVGLLAGGQEIPAWAMQRRRLIELPDGATVSTGDVWLGGTIFRAPFVETAADRAWRKIIQKRDEIMASGGVKIMVGQNERWFHTDDSSRIRMLGLNMQVPPGTQWKTMTGDFVPMTPQIAGAVFGAVAALDIAAHEAAEIHRAAMIASPDPEDYDFSGGWPETFPGV